MHIRFDVPADPAYAARVATVLSDVYLRKYRYIGFALIAVGLLGLWLPIGGKDFDAGPIFTMILVVGVLSMLFPVWARYAARRRLDGLAVDGGYDINDDTVTMRSGTESGSLDWDEVTRVTESRGFWVLFTGRTPYTVIPLQFMSADDQEALRAFLTERGSLPASPA
ncbi:YcxB family protein [Dactylosporangium sp. NBC_01737]|uniref:YcxB family protein n=1 Tax=Dactylosporangium sp. NBC_01737 TaxID=2975959 RepID=UPI002E12AF8B|nr:YcxB family protein [Dactylosporangium sp. NBC_01737]